MEHVQDVGEHARRALEALAGRQPKVFAGVRGRGLLLGLECVVPNGEVMAAAAAEGLLTVAAAENVLRILPPLIAGEREIDEALDIMNKVARGWPV